ncbi:MAG: hypothetical protein QM763_07345 [Agriterribacter sp.]
MKHIYRIIFLLVAFITCSVYFIQAQVSFQTNTLLIKINGSGNVESLSDKNGKEYLAPGVTSPLLAVSINGKLLMPERLEWQKKTSTIVLYYPSWKGNVFIKATNKKEYITFELIKIQENISVDWIAWGPYPTIISKYIGETVGTVWDENFGIGIQALNIKTLGGAPTTDDDIEPSYDIFQETGGVKDISPDRKILFRGQTAKPAAFGSVIQAYCRNRNKPKIIENWGHEKYVVPAYPRDGGVRGSKIALWGAPSDQLLTVIEKIELEEGLPHPTLNGEWVKCSSLASSSYLIMSFGENNIEDALKLTQKAGLKYLYHPGPFSTWGHFLLNKNEFPNGWKGLKNCVDMAARRGIDLGVHTLSSFITTNDAFVTPVPDKRLAKVGESIITAAIDESTKSIAIASPVFFNQMKNNNLKTVMIGTELIRYRDISKQAPWVLEDCIRGAWETKAQAHSSGDTIAKLMDHGYKVFLPDIDLQDDIAANIASLYNQAGLKQISFDGLEGSWSTGMGQYATQLFVKKWYDLLKPELKGHVINDASGPGHYFWHIFTRMNWGEPWYAGFRESQTQYRLKNQDYFHRNLMPHMLGWFSLNASTSMEDMEWLLARAAGFDAGFGLSAGVDAVQQHGYSEKILSAIHEWETARLSGAFSQKQKEGLRDIHKEFHLVKEADDEWRLFPVETKYFEHQSNVKQPGEPVNSAFTFNNPYAPQPMQFIIKLQSDKGGEAVWNNPVIEINNYDKIELPFSLSASQVLVCDGKRIRLMDSKWHLLKEVEGFNIPELNNGNNSISADGAISGGNNTVVKIEVRSLGTGELVKAGKK